MAGASSRLLIDEHPLQVLPSLAVAIGLNEAMFVQQLHYWHKRKEEAKDTRYFRDGRWWVHNTYEGWQEQFPFWSVSTVKRVIRAVEEASLVVSTTSYNQRKGDQTKWYAIDYGALHALSEEGVEEPDQEPVEESVRGGEEAPSSTDQCSKSDGQRVNMSRATGQHEQGNGSMWPDVFSTETTAETTAEREDEGQRQESDGRTPPPDDATARCLVVLKQVKGFPRDQAENAVYLMELRGEFPLVDPVEVCRAYQVWMRDNPGKAKNYRSRLRTFFARKTNDLREGGHGGNGHTRRTSAASPSDGRRWLGGATDRSGRI